ncbi:MULTISPECIES: hypothetical protein [unclassified Saccharopolyspora]|nr:MULTISPECIES: hypothetical protein [unclassified Saccharopolyspora]
MRVRAASDGLNAQIEEGDETGQQQAINGLGDALAAYTRRLVEE